MKKPIRVFAKKATNNVRYGKLQWTRVARVCRKWRTIALNSPSLWARLHHLSERSLQEVAKRNPNAPLDIDCSVEELKVIIRVFGGDALGLFRRIRRLTLMAEVLVIDNTILSHPLPVLQSLILSGPCNVPDSFFDVQIPSLKSVSLQLKQIPLDGHLFSNLDQLTLFGNWVFVRKSQEPFVAGDFLSLLQRQPHLRALTFTFPTNASACAAPLESKTVELPLLKEFFIAGSQCGQGSWFQILRYVDCPRLESFSSSFITDTPLSPSSHDRFPPLGAIHDFFIAHGTYLAKQRLVITPILMQLYDSFDTTQPHWSLRPRLSIEVNGESRDAVEWGPFLQSIADHSIAVTRLDCCNLDCQVPSSICDTIQVLRLSGQSSLPVFLRALENYGSLPSLELIYLDGLSFAPRVKTIPAIERWYLARCKAGGPKVVFNFTLCGIGESNVKALEKSKCEVRWDRLDRSTLPWMLRS
ncbi:hypothetical protein BDN71DRAFT_1497444 [Pleurotus eryngii]|uniref:F-box domain-containing protein n=1 Tax=Pleurotus eryngii TaxID=5323 RepID=A0A9P5ZQE0_PLEER|nr:hypothetical protein BDN71DRAFT_1497444 [Pleurotus eryngii]